jgi:hypothetical protein
MGSRYSGCEIFFMTRQFVPFKIAIPINNPNFLFPEDLVIE